MFKVHVVAYKYLLVPAPSVGQTSLFPRNCFVPLPKISCPYICVSIYRLLFHFIDLFACLYINTTLF